VRTTEEAATVAHATMVQLFGGNAPTLIVVVGETDGLKKGSS
jgi:hypothetical protein